MGSQSSFNNVIVALSSFSSELDFGYTVIALDAAARSDSFVEGEEGDKIEETEVNELQKTVVIGSDEAARFHARVQKYISMGISTAQAQFMAHQVEAVQQQEVNQGAVQQEAEQGRPRAKAPR